jgi:hypothetical protein
MKLKKKIMNIRKKYINFILLWIMILIDNIECNKSENKYIFNDNNNNDNSFCTHTVFPCFYYTPCNLEALENENLDLKVFKCPVGLVFDELKQKCHYVISPLKLNCLNQNLNASLVKQTLLKSLNNKNQKLTVKTNKTFQGRSLKQTAPKQRINFVNIQNQVNQTFTDYSTVEKFSNKLKDFISSFHSKETDNYYNKSSGQMSKVADKYSYFIVPIKVDQVQNSIVSAELKSQQTKKAKTLKYIKGLILFCLNL